MTPQITLGRWLRINRMTLQELANRSGISIHPVHRAASGKALGKKSRDAILSVVGPGVFIELSTAKRGRPANAERAGLLLSARAAGIDYAIIAEAFGLKSPAIARDHVYYYRKCIRMGAL
jgi:hypothetical protein